MSQEVIIGNYRITQKIGEGGMGAVYAAQHTVLGRQAAVKVLLPEHLGDEKLATRFINEARAAAAIRHPGIVEIFDFGQHQGGGLFIAMELLQGEDLEQRKRRGATLTPSQAVLFALQTCGVLDAAHRIGITHRDLKPSNIFLVPDPQVPGGERIKLLDFGIAKFAVSGEGGVAMTRAGAIMGTPTYMAPEQCLDSSKVDHRSDIYALGCIVFEMLSGRPPFVSESVVDVMTMQIHDQPPSLVSLNPAVPPALDAVVQKALAKDRDHRYQTAGEFAAALQSVMGDVGLGDGWLDASLGVSGGPTTVSGAAGAMAARRSSSTRWLIPLTAVCVIALGLGGYMFWKGRDKPETSAEIPARTEDDDPEKKLAETPAEPVWTQLESGVTEPEPASDPAAQVTWFIRSEPAGAEVRYQDKPIGHTAAPLLGRADRMPARPVRLVLRKSGHEDYVLDLDTGKDFAETISLRPNVAVEVWSKPEGAQVYKVEGNEYLGNTPLAVSFGRDREVEIAIKLEGYRDDKRTIVFDKEHKEVVKLEKLALVSVRIESEPEGAEVWLDDAKLGETPFSDTLEKQSDERRFVIKHEGCEDKEVQLSGRRDDAARVELSCAE